MRIVGVVGVIALVLASVASGRSSVADSAALVFGRSVGNIEAIYAVAADGTGLTQLSAGPNEGGPAWSPDGSQIAYAREDGDLVVMDSAAGRPRQLTSGAEIVWFSWSPDSKQIAIANRTFGREGFEIVDTVRGTVRSLRGMVVDGPPVWSPDGQTILVDDHYAGALRLIAVGDGTSRILPATVGARVQGLASAWSPSDEIAFVVHGAASPTSDNRLFLLKPNEGTRHQVASLADIGELAWSPDGTRLAFTSRRSGEGSHVWMLRLGDRVLTRLTSARNGCDVRPSWSPDSTAIAFVRERCRSTANLGLYRADVTSGAVRRLVPAGPSWVEADWPSWDPLMRPVPPKPQLAPPGHLTQIYHAGDRPVAYIVRKQATPSTFWAVSWAEYDATWVNGWGSHLAAECADRDAGTARRLSVRRWRASRGGEIRRVTAEGWNVYDRRGRKIASTSGPDGPAAGFAWLTLRGC